MTARTTYVPLHTILVVRPHPQSTKENPLPDQQIDALAEYNRTGKAFKFTPDEIADITAAHDGNLDAALRAPGDEVPDEPVAQEPASSNAPQGNKTKAAAKDADL